MTVWIRSAELWSDSQAFLRVVRSGYSRGDTYHQALRRLSTWLEPKYPASLTKLDPAKARGSWDSHQRAINQARQVLGAFGGEFSEAWHAQR